MLQRSTPPSPALFFETVNSYQRSAVLKAAVDLGCFTAIGEGHETVAALAQSCGASEHGMRVLCDYLVIIGLLEKDGQRYRLTSDSEAFLDRRSPAYLGGILEFMLDPAHVDSFRDLAAAVRKGGTVLPQDGVVAPEHPLWVRFARAMAPLMVLPAQLLADLAGQLGSSPKKVLDIAAGHGLFGITLAQQNPAAQVVALDWPNVLEVARENAQKAGVAGRYSTIAGSAFDADYGNNYDIVLLTNFLHHFDPPACEALLKKIHAALAPNGKVLTLEFVPNDDRVTPPLVASFSMMMLGTTPHGDAHTFAELDAMFRNAGFPRSELRPLPPTLQQAVISWKQ